MSGIETVVTEIYFRPIHSISQNTAFLYTLASLILLSSPSKLGGREVSSRRERRSWVRFVVRSQACVLVSMFLYVHF